MLLADMLALASRKVKRPGTIHESALNEASPRLVIDFATLTGQGNVMKWLELYVCICMGVSIYIRVLSMYVCVGMYVCIIIKTLSLCMYICLYEDNYLLKTLWLCMYVCMFV